MTIEEAIKHAEDVCAEKMKSAKFYAFSENREVHEKANDFLKSASKYQQLADWMKEEKEFRDIVFEALDYTKCQNCKRWQPLRNGWQGYCKDNDRYTIRDNYCCWGEPKEDE